MISYKKNPLPCVFSKNPVNFKVFASDWSSETNVYPHLQLEFTNKLDVGKFFQFKFINPATQNKEIITFITSLTPEMNGEEVPSLPFAGTLAVYVNTVANYMRNNSLLMNYYTLEVVGLSIIIKARSGIEELIPIEFFQNISNINKITDTLFKGFWKARKRPGHRIDIKVFFEKEYGSNLFELVSSQNDTVDINGFQNIEIASILDSEIKNSFLNPPLPETTDPNSANIVQKATVLRRFYIEVAEKWQHMLQPVKWVKSEISNVHFGGVSMDDYSRENPFNYLSSEKIALTWWRDKKRIYPEQNDWMSVMNVSNLKDANYNATLEILYKDATIDSFAIGGQPVLPWETITIPVGYNQLNIGAKRDPAKEVYGWRIKALNNAGIELVNRTYLLHQPQNFKTNTIVYLNSFGVAESFVCSGFFESNLVTSSDIASKTLTHDYKSINGRDFVFNKSSKNTFKARSGVLNKAESIALKSMLNVAPVFLLENELLRPVIIDTGSFIIDDEREITQNIEFKITKSLELTNVSEMITKPVLEIYENCGIFSAVVVSDKILTSYGSLSIYFENVLFDTVVYSGGFVSAIKVEDEGVYSFKCNVTIGGVVLELNATYNFKREVASFLSPAHNDPTNFTSFGLKSHVNEDIMFYSQNGNPISESLIADALMSFTVPVHKGVKLHEITATCLSNIYQFQIGNANYSNFELAKMIGLLELGILNCNMAGHYSVANFRNLKEIWLNVNNITSFELGMNLDVEIISLPNNSLSHQNIELFFIELYNYRKLFTAPSLLVDISNNIGTVSLTSNALAIKNGTGKYVGDGLVQNNIIVIY